MKHRPMHEVEKEEESHHQTYLQQQQQNQVMLRISQVLEICFDSIFDNNSSSNSNNIEGNNLVHS